LCKKSVPWFRLSAFSHFLVIAHGCIIANEERIHPHTKAVLAGMMQITQTFFGITIVIIAIGGKENGTNEHLRKGTTKISPSTYEAIGSTGNFTSEHAGGPKLSHHKGRISDTDKESDCGKTSS
jgi:hypothetical protein